MTCKRLFTNEFKLMGHPAKRLVADAQTKGKATNSAEFPLHHHLWGTEGLPCL